jgi:hypothetical protein
MSKSTIATVFDKIRESGGFTLDMQSHEWVTEGFAVSLNPERTMVVEGELTSDHTLAFLSDNADLLLTEKGKVFGGWVDTETGKTYLDVVTVYADREEAIKFGRFYGEIAIFDLSKGEEIRLSYEVGDPDPYPWEWDGPEPEGPGCDAAQNFLCTMPHNHNSPHVAGNGYHVLEVWGK